MSEKITFGELIETIAKETDRSKQFTHDFLKDFVDVINGGLEEDGKVNIAGFGKFELRHVDEREGFNPHTEEKITIPAHNKVVFKPYKDLRELVNAPYAHIEPKLIEQDQSTTSDEDSSTEQPQSSESPTEDEPKDLTPEISSEDTHQTTELSDDQESGEHKERSEDDFIPTAPPTSHSESKHKSEDDPFGFDQKQNSDDTTNENATEEQSDSSDTDDNGDIVEFNSAELISEDMEDESLDSFFGSEEEQDSDSEEEEEKQSTAKNNTETQEPAYTEDEDQQENESTEKTEEEVLAEEVEKLEDTAEKIKQEHAEEQQVEDLSEKTVPSKNSDRSSAYFYVAAAVVILALIAGGAWYYSTLPTDDTTMISSSETTETTTDRQQNNNAQPETDDEQQSSSTQQQQSSASQNQSTTNAGSSASAANQQQKNETSIELEKGQTLWSLAEKRYGNPRLWPWIYGKNESIEDPDVIYAGNSLSIPLPSGPQNTLNATDSVGVAKGFLATYKWYKNNEQEKAKNHLWAAKSYHTNLQQIADIPIDQADLSYVNKAR